MVGCWYVPGTHVERYKLSTDKTKISRIRYTWYQRSGTTNHPHHLGTDVTFSLPRPQHLTKTSLFVNRSTIPPPPSVLITISHFVLWLIFFLFVCTWCSCWCVLLIFFIWDCCWLYFFYTYLLFTPGYLVFHLVTHTHRPIPTHPICKGFALTRIALHWNVGWW